MSCPGAESCRLAVTQSRGLGRLLGDTLLERQDLVDDLPGLDIRISGCPNGCGQHHIAGIGFQGSLRKVDGRPAPHYFVLVGGGTSDGVTTFGRVAATVPARRSVEAMERLGDALAAALRDIAERPPPATLRPLRDTLVRYLAWRTDLNDSMVVAAESRGWTGAQSAYHAGIATGLPLFHAFQNELDALQRRDSSRD